MSSGPPTSIATRVRKRPGLLELDQRSRIARTAGLRTRYTAQANRARPMAVRICSSDQRVRSETGLATAPPTLPGRPVRADSPSVVTTEELFGFFDVFEPFVFDAMASSIPTPPRGQSRPRGSEPTYRVYRTGNGGRRPRVARGGRSSPSRRDP